MRPTNPDVIRAHPPTHPSTPPPRQVYRNDVMLQMTSKALGDDYNRITRPPKKVDFVQAALVEFTGREGRPVCAIEDMIEGDYVKYNRWGWGVLVAGGRAGVG